MVDPTVELIVDEPETSTETMAEVVMAELDPPEPPAPPAPPPDAVEVTVEEGTVFKVVSVVVATLLDPPDPPAPPAVAAIHWLANYSEGIQLCEIPMAKREEVDTTLALHGPSSRPSTSRLRAQRGWVVRGLPPQSKRSW